MVIAFDQLPLNRLGRRKRWRRRRGAYHGSVPREPFTRDQLDYIERSAMRAMRVWNRALKHLDRTGANQHELYQLIRNASDAEHGLRVHAMYAKHDVEKRVKEKTP